MVTKDLQELLSQAGREWSEWIERSFLSEEKKAGYRQVGMERLARLG